MKFLVNLFSSKRPSWMSDKQRLQQLEDLHKIQMRFNLIMVVLCATQVVLQVMKALA